MMNFVSVTQVASELAAHVDELAERVVDQVWERVPGYEAPRVSRTDLADTVAPNLRSVIGMLVEPVVGDEMAERAYAIGVSRALQGVPLDAVVLSYRAAERVLSDAFVAHVQSLTSEELRDGLRQIADGFDRLATSSLESYRETQREVTAHYDRVAGDLVAGLVGGDLDAQQVRRLARILGVDPDGRWWALVIWVGSDPDLATSVRFQRDVLGRLGRGRVGRILAGSARGYDVLLVPGRFQEADRSGVERMVAARSDAQIWLTVGDEVSGLAEAGVSCRQALVAMDVATSSRPGGSVVAYDEVVLDILAGADADAASALVNRYVAPIRGYPHLVEAVEALAASDMSIRGAAGLLFVHPNTITYRLGRVHELTGRDPRRFTELMAFVIALRAPASCHTP